MNRLCCLLAGVVFSGLACAGEATLLQPLVFSQAPDTLTPPNVAMDETVAESMWTDTDLASRSWTSSDQRRASRERVFTALGVSRFIPNGHFTAFGNKARWSLSLNDEDSVVVRFRVKW